MRAFCIQVPLCFIVLLAGALPASAHAPPPLVMSFELDQEALHGKITLGADLFRDWVTSLMEDKWGRATEGPLVVRAERFLAEALKVEADGVVVRPVVEEVATRAVFVHGAKMFFVDVSVHYGMKGKLRSLGLAWTRYENGLEYGISPIDTELSAYGSAEYPVLTEKEPGYTWHAPVAAKKRSATIPPPVTAPPTITVPWLSAALVLLALVLLIVLLRHRAGKRTALAVLAFGLLAAFLLRGVATSEVTSPWAPGFRMPTKQQAAQIFEGLHRNIYRAFDYDTEDAVYETLARSVEGDLLDAVYGEVYRSLILEDQGGAVCTIQQTKILENEVELPDDPDARAFHTVCRWRVRGKVGHWGHTHIRVNEYRARYLVRFRGNAWRIAEVEILEQKRVQR